MKFDIESTFEVTTEATVDLPVKSWDEVKKWSVKMDTFRYTLDGEQWHEVYLGSPVEEESCDWTSPLTVRVYDKEDTLLEELK